MWLPASIEAAAREPARESDEVPTGSETILVVDDEEAVPTATTRLLDRLGYHVLRARDGREAVAFARRAEVAIDAAILDLDMPVMGGIESFPLLRAAQGGVPILLCSGFELDPESLHARGVAADGLLAKPVGREVIGRMLREALDRRGAPRA